MAAITVNHMPPSRPSGLCTWAFALIAALGALLLGFLALKRRTAPALRRTRPPSGKPPIRTVPAYPPPGRNQYGLPPLEPAQSTTRPEQRGGLPPQFPLEVSLVVLRDYLQRADSGFRAMRAVLEDASVSLAALSIGARRNAHKEWVRRSGRSLEEWISLVSAGADHYAGLIGMIPHLGRARTIPESGEATAGIQPAPDALLARLDTLGNEADAMERLAGHLRETGGPDDQVRELVACLRALQGFTPPLRVALEGALGGAEV